MSNSVPVICFSSQSFFPFSSSSQVKDHGLITQLHGRSHQLWELKIQFVDLPHTHSTETFTSSYLLNQPEYHATTLHYHSSNDHQEGTVSNGTKRAGSSCTTDTVAVSAHCVPENPRKLTGLYVV